MNRTPREMMEKCRIMLLLDSPFYAIILLGLNSIETEEATPTMATDGVSLYYNPIFIKEINGMHDLKFILLHEIIHIILMHHLRRGNRDPMIWNIAADYAVNSILINTEGIAMPIDVKTGKPMGLYDIKYKKMSAEDIYEDIYKEYSAQQEGKGVQLVEDGGDGESKFRIYPGEVRDYRQGGPESEGLKKLVEKDMYTSTVEQKVKELTSRLEEALLSVGKMPGSVPGWAKHLIQDYTKPLFSWECLLANYMTKLSRDDYQWTRPNRRYLYAGYYYPALQIPTLGDIIIIMDTSASVTEKDMADFASEIVGILGVYPDTTLKVIYVDTEVSNVEDVEISELVFHPAGRGGTDFVKGFEYIEEHDIPCDAVLYFTDGECNSFPKEPGYPVLWVCKRRNSSAEFIVPFGDVVYFKERQRIKDNKDIGA
jgi:predicted metal-dependent peptidase